MFSALAEGTGDLKDKINLFVAIDPITNIGFSSVKFFPTDEKQYKDLTKPLISLDVDEIRGPKWNLIEKVLCVVFPCGFLDQITPEVVASEFNDADITDFIKDRNRLEKSSSSTKQLLHFM